MSIVGRGPCGVPGCVAVVALGPCHTRPCHNDDPLRSAEHSMSTVSDRPPQRSRGPTCGDSGRVRPCGHSERSCRAAAIDGRESADQTLRHCSRHPQAGHKRTGAVQPGEGAHHALPLPGNRPPRCVAGHRMRTTTAENGACGAPVARKRARRVREAARGNPPVETPAGRPGSTSRSRLGSLGRRRNVINKNCETRGHRFGDQVTRGRW